MLSLRKQRLDRFREQLVAGNGDDEDHLFRIVYGLPLDLQVELARYMTARFLPIYERNHPQVTWPRTVLDGVFEYFDATGHGLPDEPEEIFGGDAEFEGCLHGLSVMWKYARRDDLARVTCAFCTTLISAVGARAANVWWADDPEAVQAWQNDDWVAAAGRRAGSNVASRAVTKREWLLVADWLDDHDAASYPDTEDAERERMLEWWKERECVL